jgi:hypothetical protein
VEPRISDNGGNGMIGDCRFAIGRSAGRSIMEYTPNALEERLIDFWLRFVHRLCGSTVDTDRLTRECSELIAVFVSGINTAKAKSRRRQQGQPAG